MSAAKQTSASVGVSTEVDIRERAEIDRSVRLPVLFFFTSAAVWLVLSAVLGLITSLKLTMPGILDFSVSFPLIERWSLDLGAVFGYGRSYPALMNAMIYGWGFQAAFGAAIWIQARLCRVPLKSSVAMMTAGHFWNIAVTLGVLSILFGKGTSILWLEFPSLIWPVLLLAYMCIAVPLVVMFRARRKSEVYISQWYILAACFLFPWTYLTANLLIHVFPGSAVMATAISGWYSSSLVYLWFAPIGLATSYYLIPKILGRPIYNYNLATVGFWALIIFGGWSGMQRYMGGPLPAWMPMLGSAAAILLLLPALAVGVNQFMSVRGHADHLHYSPTLRFTIFGTIGFAIMVLFGAGMAFFGIGRFLQFTLAQEGYDMMVLYGFFSMTMFGAFYFIAPRVTRCEWLSAKMIGFHYWASAYGVLTLVALITVGGLSQGVDIAAWEKPFIVSVTKVKTWGIAQCIGWTLILLSNLMFLFHVLLMSIRFGRQGDEGPTLLASGHGVKTGELNAGGAGA